jgi:hypothetical protein
MMRWLLALLALTVAACAHSAHDSAVLATNTTQNVLQAVDEVWTPIVQEQIEKAKTLDDAAYKDALAPYQIIQEAIEEARRATQLLNLAVQTWDAQSDEGAMFGEVVPCVVQDVQLIRALLIARPTVPPQIVTALRVIETSLGALGTPGATCARAKPAAVLAAATAGATP